MELPEKIIAKIFEERIDVALSNLKINAIEIVEMQSYQALQKIRAILENDSLSDFECIEKIVCIFEEIGSDSGNRHDFG